MAPSPTCILLRLSPRRSAAIIACSSMAPARAKCSIEHGTCRPAGLGDGRQYPSSTLLSSMPVVDPDRIALNGWSLGGYLAPRAASGEHRLAACIADPGLWGMAWGLRVFLRTARSAARGRGKPGRDRTTAARQDVADHQRRPRPAMDGDPARFLGERLRQPSRFSPQRPWVHDGRPGRVDPLPDLGHAGRRGPAGGERAGVFRGAALPEGAHSFQRSRGRRRPLRGEESIRV